MKNILKKGPTPFPVTFPPEIDSADIGGFYRLPEELISRGCSDVNRALMVKSDGRVISCHGRCYDVTVGNVRDQPLPTIWNASKPAERRRRLRSAGGRSRCCSAF